MLVPGAPVLDIAVIGSGVAGLACAWLLAQRHRVTLYEADGRLGGHCNTVEVETPAGPLAIDTGFIVYNEGAYPNLTALFHHLNIATRPTDMSFSVSIGAGELEYASTGLQGLFAQRQNIMRGTFYRMLVDINRFYRQAPKDLAQLSETGQTLESYLDQGKYSKIFCAQHLLPMASAIWSCSDADAGQQPAASFIRFFINHGLLRLTGRPQWRTVLGGSRTYIARLGERLAGRIRSGCRIDGVQRHGDQVQIWGPDLTAGYDHVVIACHADQALKLLGNGATSAERSLLGSFRYTGNEVVLHTDRSLMPRRHAAWASWNYLKPLRERHSATRPYVSYWMNRLQHLPGTTDYILSLNPPALPTDSAIYYQTSYEHPVMDASALQAQRQLWHLQGVGGLWYCGAHFGAGFHEDGLQAGLAVAEQLGGVRRPWTVGHESSRIHLGQKVGV